MTTMLERAARAIAVEWYCETSHDDAVAVAAAETQWTAFESLARAALQAIREIPESISGVAEYDEYDWAGRVMSEQEQALVAAMREVRSFMAGQAVLLLDLPGYRNAYAAMFEAMKPYEPNP